MGMDRSWCEANTAWPCTAVLASRGVCEAVSGACQKWDSERMRSYVDVIMATVRERYARGEV
jgi:hypothetical protein